MTTGSQTVISNEHVAVLSGASSTVTSTLYSPAGVAVPLIVLSPSFDGCVDIPRVNSDGLIDRGSNVYGRISTP